MITIRQPTQKASQKQKSLLLCKRRVFDGRIFITVLKRVVFEAPSHPCLEFNQHCIRFLKLFFILKAHIFILRVLKTKAKLKRQKLKLSFWKI